MNYFSSKNKNKLNKQNGQAILVVVIMCTAIFLVIVLGVVSPIVNELKLSHDLLRSKASLYVAESSSEDAVYRVKNNMISNYTLPIYLSINGYEATTTVSNTAGVKTIDTTGSDNSNFRNIETKIVSGVGTNFYYGVQAGSGGFSLTGGGQINGNVYSNGSVTATNGVTITGSVVAANPSGSTATVGGGSYVGAVNVGTAGVGDVWAHNVTGASVQGTIYCQTGAHNNKSCNTSRSDPPSQPLPITDADIQTWKAYATSTGNIYSGNFSTSNATTVGPMEITGNLTVSGTGILTLAGTVWVQGNVTFSNSSKLKLASGYGSSGGVIVSDGLISLGGSTSYDGSGATSSYPLLITTSSSASAIDAGGGSGAVVLVAQSGTITLGGGSGARALSAKNIIVNGSGTVTYDPGLVNFDFSSGPSGTWSISSWKEVQ